MGEIAIQLGKVVVVAVASKVVDILMDGE